jgi:EAL domain-containing protein (putative c-di-GMP-specific phosphodiesterase class I)
LRHADIAMYAAKRSAAGYAMYEAASDPHSTSRLALISGLRQAIERGDLALYYQPILDIRNPGAARVEALVRWHHQDGNPIAPGEFVPLAEHAGLIRPLALWVMNEAVRQIGEWERMGLHVLVAVNLSVWNLQDREIVASVAEILQRWNVAPASLRVEITESALMADPERALETVSDLHEMGVSISIDDFGTGYSSLGYLNRLPVDEIKIDRSFVHSAVGSDSGAFAIIRSVIDLGHNLRQQVVAEGVETRQSAELLSALGCDLLQGFYFSPPLPADQYASWLRDRERRDTV